MTTIFSLKGGVGKTSLSSAIALEMEFEKEEIPIITNDPISPLESVMGKNRALLIPPDEKFPPSLKTDDDVLIDLGGFVDERSIEILEKSKQVIVPTLGSYLSLAGLVGTLEEVKKFNNEITIVLNRVEKKELDKVIEFIRDSYDYPIFKLKTSKCFENIHYQKKSISQMMTEEPLMKRAYKEVQAQVWEIINHLKGV